MLHNKKALQHNKDIGAIHAELNLSKNSATYLDHYICKVQGKIYEHDQR